MGRKVRDGKINRKPGGDCVVDELLAGRDENRQPLYLKPVEGANFFFVLNDKQFQVKMTIMPSFMAYNFAENILISID